MSSFAEKEDPASAPALATGDLEKETIITRRDEPDVDDLTLSSDTDNATRLNDNALLQSSDNASPRNLEAPPTSGEGPLRSQLGWRRCGPS